LAIRGRTGERTRTRQQRGKKTCNFLHIRRGIGGGSMLSGEKEDYSGYYWRSGKKGEQILKQKRVSF